MLGALVLLLPDCSGRYSLSAEKIRRSSQGATRRILVVPGLLNGTPAVTTIWSISVANPSLRAARAALTTAILKRSTGSVVTTQCIPQVRTRRRAVVGSGVIAMIGTRGRSRAVFDAVVPDWVKQQIALMSTVSAISRAADTIASDTVERLPTRLASMRAR